MSDGSSTMYAKLGLAAVTISQVTKDKTVSTGKYEYSYVDLNTVLAAVKEALARQGLTLLQPLNTRDGHIFIDTLIIDAEGDYIHFPGPGFPVKGDPQAMGSEISYGRRYALTSMFAMNVVDDDGGMAHRADTSNGHRTAAETEIRDIIKGYDSEILTAYQNDFRAQFGSGLASLPESRHGEVLAWTRKWEASE